jgi:hypothetical protein
MLVFIPCHTGDLPQAAELQRLTWGLPYVEPDDVCLVLRDDAGRVGTANGRWRGWWVSRPFGWPQTPTEMFCGLIDRLPDGEVFAWIEPDACWTRATGYVEVVTEWGLRAKNNPDLCLLAGAGSDGVCSSGIGVYRITPGLRRAVSHVHRTHAFDTELYLRKYVGIGDVPTGREYEITPLIADLWQAGHVGLPDPLAWVANNPKAALLHADKKGVLQERLNGLILEHTNASV